ncbi:TrmH family RNA methyltransferase [Helcococcus sueciensis]|uniref:TrmH family RNA methyltransferase n=1 Tax=Helcococcus sueciensis TaxID=241555 RepID=UPI0003FAFCA0|nr:RNA methyltransferase [Helcococcus sueciensis]
MKEVIKSSKNNLIKMINKLKKKKFRNEKNLFLIETRKMIDEAIKSNRNIEYIIQKESNELVYDNSILIEDKLFNEISNLVTPDGYMAIVSKYNEDKLSENILILDNIQDPGNMGTLIRSAEAFGYNTIISINSVDYYNEKVLRSTMGSIFRLNLIETNYEFINTLNDYKIYIADMNGEDFKEIESSQKKAIVIGNEGNGISEEIKKIPHKLVKIPMQGKVESLNAAVSGSILMSTLK